MAKSSRGYERGYDTGILIRHEATMIARVNAVEARDPNSLNGMAKQRDISAAAIVLYTYEKGRILPGRIGEIRLNAEQAIESGDRDFATRMNETAAQIIDSRLRNNA